MGYTTEFSGQFTFDRELPAGALGSLVALEGEDTRDLDDGVEYPGHYCQWVLNSEHNGLVWDREEKFDAYVEWLQWLIDNVFKPAGVSLRGRVEYQGDETTDHGFLVVEDDQHVRIESIAEVSDELDELKRFRDFVLQHRDFGTEVIEAWRDHKS
jgi:hypothetical protein